MKAWRLVSNRYRASFYCAEALPIEAIVLYAAKVGADVWPARRHRVANRDLAIEFGLLVCQTMFHCLPCSLPQACWMFLASQRWLQRRWSFGAWMDVWLLGMSMVVLPQRPPSFKTKEVDDLDINSDLEDFDVANVYSVVHSDVGQGGEDSEGVGQIMATSSADDAASEQGIFYNGGQSFLCSLHDQMEAEMVQT